MEPRTFDELSRALAGGTSRRSVLKGLFGAAVAIMAGSRVVSAAAEKVGVCHYTGSADNPWQYIDIADAAVQTHIDHGDDLFDLGQSTKHCGTCGNTCTEAPEHASPACIEGACGFTCDEGYVPDASGGCACDVTCSGSLVLNESTCACECSVTCDEGFRLTDACTCECTRTCPEGQTLDPGTCACGCGESTCSEFQTQDPETCTCACSQTCGEGFTQNPETCQCVADACEPQVCQTPMSWNSTTCQCECERTCADPFVLDPATCSCACSITSCPEGFTLDATTCTCIRTKACDPVEETACTENGGTWDATTCTCAVAEEKCPPHDPCAPGLTWDESTCSCVEDTCDPATQACQK